MQNETSSESGFFRPRILVALSLCFLGGMLALYSTAAPTPASDTLTRTHNVSYTDPLGAPPNITHVALGKPNCGPSEAACSVFNLTISPSVKTAAPGYDPAQYQILFQWNWAVATVDYDLFIEDTAGNLIAKNTSTADPSSIIIPANQALNAYKLVVVLSTGAPIAYTGTVTLQPAPPTSGLCNPAVANCAPPRYQNFPAGPSQANNAGEPSLGVDWNPNVPALKHDKVNTGGVAFFTSGSNEWRVNFDDCSSPAINLWEDKSALFTQTFVLSDPIGFVDHYSSLALGLSYPPPQTPGRVFSLDLIGGQGNSTASYSDNDGNSYLPGGNGGPGAGPDHETLGGGPYSPTQTVPISHPNYPNAIYYCSQNIVAEAQCSRSDDGGQSFGPAVPIFSPSQCTGGIHGHVKVARDGTVYVPNSSCGTTGTAGVAVSNDNGLTWTENNVTDSTSSQDPSVGIGQNNVGKPGGQATNTIYLGYVDGDGHAKVARSGDKGANYSQPVDVGAPFGITHAVFPVVVAGDDNRAAFAFLGTGNGISTNANTCNPYGAVLNCKNIWHLYVATTYDGGANWITVDATPQDPAQSGTVCLEGTTCAGGRNLLDFNDFAIDSQGRGLVGWADGCVNCSNTFSGQSNASHGTVTRQSGGRRLFAFFDPVEPAVPAPPQLISAVRGAGGVLVTWLEPDNGGSPIIGYNVYRGAASGAEIFLASVSGATETKYLDAAAPAGNLFYFVRAVNAVGEGTQCREVSLSGGPGPETECTAPGLSKLSDPPSDTNATCVLSGVTTPAPPGSDLLKFQIAQPYQPDGIPRLVFTLTTNNGMSPQPAGSSWYVSLKVPVSTRAPKGYIAAHMTWKPGTPNTPIFESYEPGPSAVPPVQYDGRFVKAGTQRPAEPGSSYVTPFNQVVIVVKASDLGLQPGDVISGFVSATTQTSDPANVGTGATCVYDSMPNDVAGVLTYTGSYTVDSNQFCRPNLEPTAILTATPMSGNPPLLVHFNGAGSTDPDTLAPADTIASYTFNFGDGSAPVTQSTATINHTYNANGEYPARLTVKDSRGKASTNVAQVVIAVAGNTPPTADLKANPTSGHPPLKVEFDATGSFDADFSDTIASYTFHFGDGTPDIIDGNEPIVNHTYAAAGTYAARLVVKDSRGEESENTAQQIITVTQTGSSPTPTPTPGGPPPTPTPTPVSSPTATPSGSPTPTPTATPGSSPTATPGSSPTATPSGSPTATPTASPSASPTATPAPTPVNVQLLNISGRVNAKTGDKVGIGGFIITGSGTKRIMARAIGTSLKAANGTALQGRLQDPYLELHDSHGSAPLTNDDWRTKQQGEIQQTGLAPKNEHESAIVKRLPAGTYTAIIHGADNSPGIGVVELYDLSSTEPGELGNLSVRADVGTDDNVLIDGMILRGGDPKRVLFRALGPSVKENGATVPGALQDPTLDVYDGNGTLLRGNDDWQKAPNANEIQATGLAPPDEHESAVLLKLDAGNYTAIVRGKDRSTGIALAEAYKLDN